MKFTASALWSVAASGGAKSLTWKVYVRKTATLNQALTGTWTEVTDRLDVESFPDILYRIEYEVGIFSIDALDLTGHGIAWWKANVFNASASEYIELKVELTLGGASDTAYMFAGFVDKVEVTYTELTDSVAFTAYTAMDLASRLAAENVSTQYINPDTHGDNSNVAGLILQKIAGMFLVDADVPSYPMRVGEHSITYDYNNGSQRFKLDEGRWTTLVAGDNTTGDGETAGEDVQRVQVYVPSLILLGGTDYGEQVDYVVVVTQGETLCNQWYANVSLRHLITKMYEAVGIDTITIDDMQITTFDSRNTISFIETPPDDATTTGVRFSIETDGTDLFMAVGNKVYKRTLSSGAYTLLATLGAGEKVSRLIYHKRVGDHEDLWIFHGANVNGNGKVSCYRIDAAALTNTVTLTSTADATKHNSVGVVDYNYTGSSYKYAFLYTETAAGTGGYFGEVTRSGSTLTDTVVFNGNTNFGYSTSYGILANFLFIKTGGLIRFQSQTDATHWEYSGVSIDGSGNYVAGGTAFTLVTDIEGYSVAAYDSAEDRIYFFQDYNETGKIWSHTGTAGTYTENKSLGLQWTVHNMFFANSLVYFTAYDTMARSENVADDYFLYSVTGNGTASLLDSGAYTKFSQLTYGNSRLYGIDVNGLLFQFTNQVVLYVPFARFAEMSILESLNKVLNGFGIISTISATKKAFVYLRGDASGTPLTTGNTLSLTISNSSELEEVTKHYPAIELIRIAGQTDSVTYDGVTYNAAVLSDRRFLDISSEYVPDTILKDLAKWMWAFFSINRNLYKIELGHAPLFQYEPFDSCSITFADTKIVKTGSGPIYSALYRLDGSMAVETLI